MSRNHLDDRRKRCHNTSMNAPGPSSRELLKRMLVRVDEMRRALTDASAAAGDRGGGDEVDLARAVAALDDLERRVRRMLVTEASPR